MMRTGALAAAIMISGCGGGGGNNTDARPPADARIFDADTTDSGTAVIPEDLPDPLPAGDVSGDFVTFNAGLIQVVKGSEERMPLQITALKALDADVICLQEIFDFYTNPPNHAALLADTYPYSYWTWTGEAQLGNGLLIVSKHPLYRGRELFYTMGNSSSIIVNRMAIGVTVVDANEGWHANVVCTHLHAGLEDNDPAIRLNEAQELRTWAAAENLDDGPSILLGDMNSGPVPASFVGICECSDEGEQDAGPPICDDCTPADLNTWNELQMTWTDPHPENADFATSGREQFLTLAVVPGLYPNEPTQRIDHCMYKDLGGAAFSGSDLVLDEDPNLTVDDETLHYLSDHTGLRCTFE